MNNVSISTDVEILSDDEARALYTTGDAAHDFDHVLRVTRMAIHIAEAEGADRTVVRLAALLHDVPVPATVNDNDHAVQRLSHHMAAANYARHLLSKRGLGTFEVEKIVHCIEAHRFRDQSVQPQTLEAQCLYDADKLDAFGAIGIARVFAFAGAHDHRLWTTKWREIQDAPTVAADYTPVHEFVFKLQRLQATLFTATARAIGKERHDFMRLFFDRLDLEMGELG